FISLAFRYQDFYVFREFNADKAHQLHGAYQLLQGNGVSLESYDLNTLQAHQRPLIAWPPAYSYLVAGASKISGLSVFEASWAVDVLTLAALWCVLLWLSLLLRFTLLQTAILFVLFGLCRTPWVYLWSADIIGTVLFLYSAALNVSFIQQKGTQWTSVRFAFLQFILIGTMVFLKYSLFPVYTSLCLSVFSFSWKAEKKHYRMGIMLAATIFVLLGLLLLYNKTLTNHATEMGSRYRKGLFFENLLMFNAFLFHAFIYLEGIMQRMQSYWLQYFLQILNAVFVAFILFHLGKKMLAGKADYFSHLVFWTTVSVCSFLAFLSVYYPQEVFVGTYHWTYVKELHYFSSAAFLLTIYLIRNFHMQVPRTIFAFLAFAFIGLAAVYGLGLTTYYTLTKNRAASFENMIGHAMKANEFIRKHQDSNTYFLSLTGNQAVDAQVLSIAAINGAKVTFNYDGFFPDEYLAPLFTKQKTFPPGKKIIVYLESNMRVVDSLLPGLAHHIEQNQDGQNFLVVNP
ncbi:MAG: hypothetical protein M3Y85_10250, partial [Bacteroidota bacterium]|nr:hypothetical protein [Bacteroidota bacterium]